MQHLPRIVLIALALTGGSCTSDGAIDWAAFEQPAQPSRPQRSDRRDDRPPPDDGVRASVVLRRAAAAPYALPPVLLCRTIVAELAELDAVLGPDIDELTPAEISGEAEGDDARSASMRVLVNIPYSDAALWLAGTGPRDREVRRIVLGGVVRRSYLRGVASGMDCVVQRPNWVSSATPERRAPRRRPPSRDSDD